MAVSETKTVAAEPISDETEGHAPIILDLGKRKRRDVRKLRKGRGRLLERAAVALEQLKEEGTLPASVRPVILIVREKRRSGGKLFRW
jgi:hypothetical protein